MSAAIDRLREQLTREGPTNLVLVVRTADLREALSAIESAEARERAACALVVDQFMIELCGITGDIFSVQYYARDLAQRTVKLAADRIRARGEQRAPIAHAHRCACGKPATHEQCGGLLVCDEHIGPGRAWPIDAKTIELCGDGFNAPSSTPATPDGIDPAAAQAMR